MEGPDRYDEYLLRLQQKNRLLKQLKAKDEDQIELERKEQGFSLYVNGANENLEDLKYSPRKPAGLKPKTAGEAPRRHLIGQIAQFNTSPEDRARTAPSKVQRRNWQQASVDIKTNEGSKVKLKVKDKPADYSEDFEVDDSLEGASHCWHEEEEEGQESEGDGDLEHMHKNMTILLETGSSDNEDPDDDSDMEVDAEKYNHGSSSDEGEIPQEGEIPRQLLLSIDDIKNLRRSLEANADIRESIGRQGNERNSDSSSDDDIEEELEEEEEEEAEREVSEDIAPGDMIVLDFGLDNKDPHRHQRHLAAKRKPDSEEVFLESSPRMTPTNQSVDTVVCLSATLTPRSSRPLSSQRKVDKLWDQESDLTEIQRAIQAENSALSARSIAKDGETSSRTEDEAPPKPSEEEEGEIPGGSYQPETEALGGGPPPTDLISSQNLDEYKMGVVVDKVKQMDARSQKKLLRQLGKLEESTTSPQKSPEKTVRTTAVTSPSQNDEAPFSTPKLAPRAMSAVTLKSPRATTVDVTLEILSNWGHPSRVGLTEMEFYNNNGERVLLTPTDVWVQGTKSMQGMLGNLVNGRTKIVKRMQEILDNLVNGSTKTTRERNMWSCSLDPEQPIVLHFKVRMDREEEAATLKQIKIWNYNKSLRDLNVGVKNARLLLNKDIIWEGIVEKGCGNQVFDYSLTVEVPAPHDPTAGPQDMDHRKSEATRSDYGRRLASHTPGNSQSMDGETADLQVSRPDSSSGMVGSPDDGQTSCTSTTRLNLANQSIMQGGSVDHGTTAHPARDFTRSKTKILERSASQTEDSIEEIGDVATAEQESTSESCMALNEPGKSPSLMRMSAPDRTSSKDSDTNGIMFSGDFGSILSNDSAGEVTNEGMDFLKGKQAPGPPDNSAKLPSSRKEASSYNYGERLLSGEPGELAQSTVDEQPSIERSKTRILKRSTDNLSIPTVDDSIQIFASTRVSVGTSQDNSSGQPTQEMSVGLVPQMGVKAEAVSDSEDFSQEEMSMLQQLQNLNVAKRETPKPPWLMNKKVEEPDENDEPLFGMETFPPKSSTGAIREGTPVADDLEDARWRQTEDQGSATYSSAEPNRRSQWRGQRQLSLEESWTSLSMFDKSQKGRLTANMNMEMAGDSLDDYLNQRHVFEVQDDNKDDSSEEFEIPVLPYGQQVKILIRTTWGDKHYVGLNGIEVFLNNGELASIAEITANPPDINILEEYAADPRVVTNLIDGINHTRDDTHMWLAPYIHGQNSLQISFSHPVKVAMIRIWNYNKSRIHSFRGAKDIEMYMEDRCIFKGEIDRASGAREGDMEAFGDTILFTEDGDILELISKHDEAYISQTEDWFSSSMEDDLIPERPRTADEGEERPFTAARKFRKKRSDERGVPKARSDSALLEGDVSPPFLEERYIPSAMETAETPSTASRETVFNGRYLKLVFTATWGDYYYLGLTGLEVMGPDGGPIALSLDQMDANPRDLNILPDYGSDDRTLDKVIDGENITTSDEHMWMIPFSEGEDHVLTIDLRNKVQLSGLRVWNYNKNPEDTYRGAKTMHVFLDSRQLSPKGGFLIRKGPGNCCFDFAQEIAFGGDTKIESAINQALPKTIQDSLRSSIVASEEPSQEYISMHMPCGFVFQFQLLCTWGDQYYVGLNGIEFYNETGKKIALTETNVAAYPPSINVLDGAKDDMRTPDKLIDGINDSKDGMHTWLAPILPAVINKVFVIFDEPVTVSMIKLWNYSKTPWRGVKEFGLYLDDLLIYNGILGQVSTGARGILPTIELPAQYHTILFTDDLRLLQQEKHTIIHNRPQDQDVQMTNDREVVEKHSAQKAATTVDQALRPKTSIVHGMGSGVIRR